MKKVILATSAALILAACSQNNNVIEMSNRDALSLIEFEKPSTPHNVLIEKNRLFADTEKVSGQLLLNAQECGTQHPTGYIKNLVDDYKDSISLQYGFEYAGEGQGVPTYWVTLHPNTAGYQTMKEFKKDFDICNPFRGKFPHDLNEDWLMLVGSCGKDYFDGTEKPRGCWELREEVQPSIKLAELN